MGMKNAIQFLHAALRNRPREQRIPIPQNFVKQLMKGIETQATEILTHEGTIHQRDKKITELGLALVTRDKELAEFKSELTEADARILALQNDLDSANKRIQDMVNNEGE